MIFLETKSLTINSNIRIHPNTTEKNEATLKPNCSFLAFVMFIKEKSTKSCVIIARITEKKRNLKRLDLNSFLKVNFSIEELLFTETWVWFFGKVIKVIKNPNIRREAAAINKKCSLSINFSALIKGIITM